jgi:CBS domain-containing protein
MDVKDLMREAFVIDKDAGLKEAARIMASKNIGCLLMVSGKKIKGIITERDLLKNFNKDIKVSQIMTKSVVSISPNAEISEAIRLMNSKRIKRLPVVDKDELVGIITATDLLANADEFDEDFFFE